MCLAQQNSDGEESHDGLADEKSAQIAADAVDGKGKQHKEDADAAGNQIQHCEAQNQIDQPPAPGTRSLRGASMAVVPSARSLAASIWAGETWNRLAMANSSSPACA